MKRNFRKLSLKTPPGKWLMAAASSFALAVQTNDNTQGCVNEGRLYLQKPYSAPANE